MDASSPFDSPSADVILRSSDSVDFRFFKLLLSLSSSFFRGLFNPNRELTEDGNVRSGANPVISGEKDGLPIVPLTESSETLTGLLNFIHPEQTATFDTLDSLLLVLKAAEKYRMDGVIRRAETSLMAADFLESQPVVVYVIACVYKLEKAARAGAKASLCQPMLFPFSKELEGISGASLYRLLAYRDTCEKEATEVTERVWAMSGQHRLFWQKSQARCSCPIATSIQHGHNVKAWCWEYLEEILKRLRQRVNGDVLRDHTLVMPYLGRSVDCESCRGTAARDIAKFAGDAALAVDEAISKVRFKIEF
ncbi:hypothetical protein JAAARDRAFT_42085 [Jaapia argillacea MUCL 33604]|uniref:BTB domain-containing protein n=1 Tax=Jaapia argillacea MUCL 33604 TaxID=933084 RepID=A0A067PHG9_9AGAM|nr:hypothetical protein JAAARDRAFT_42085 [Jaapia argillacea MUCL 33604]